MDSPEVQITVPTFINPHTFWIVPIKDLLLRSAMNRYLKTNATRRIKDEDVHKKPMVAINVENIWTRAVINRRVTLSDGKKKYLCWLPDYGTAKTIDHIFYLPEEMRKCPHLAKRASLYNVVNLAVDYSNGSGGYKIHFKKTLDDTPAVNAAILNWLENADKLYFSVIGDDQYNIFGDIICQYQETEESLTDNLIKTNLMEIDKVMFKKIGSRRDSSIEKYFSQSQTWQRQWDLPEKKHISRTTFNTSKTESMEFFERMYGKI